MLAEVRTWRSVYKLKYKNDRVNDVNILVLREQKWALMEIFWKHEKKTLMNVTIVPHEPPYLIRIIALWPEQPLNLAHSVGNKWGICRLENNHIN